MKHIIMALFLAVSVAWGQSNVAPVPIAYSNEVRYVRYERNDGYRSITNMPYAMEAINSQRTNAPVAIIHCVTYGVGTNALFKLWTLECLPTPKSPWRNAEWIYYEHQTWITKP